MTNKALCRHNAISDEIAILIIIVAFGLIFITGFFLAGIIWPPIHVGAPYFKVDYLEIEDNLLQVKVYDRYDLDPISNVSIGIYEHGTQTLLVGPRITNESGIVVIEMPQGYKDYFDIKEDFHGRGAFTSTDTYDQRFWMYQWYDRYGPLGTTFIGAIITAIFGAVGVFIKMIIDEHRKKKHSTPENETSKAQSPPPGYG